MNEIRYDGPDVEAEAGGRVQGVTMVAMMVGEGLQAGRREARAQAEQATAEQLAAQAAADRQTWSRTPLDELAELTDEQVAIRWQATARHPDDGQGNRVRHQLEKELDQRDPETMRDYRSWRNAGAADPGLAMQMALHEREVRLARSWQPLATDRAAALDEIALPTAWAAALGAHNPDATAAVTAGEGELRRRLPDRMAPYDHAIARGSSPADAAAASWGTGQDAFGPTATWKHIAEHGVPPVGVTSRSAVSPATTVSPATRAVLAAAHRGQLR